MQVSSIIVLMTAILFATACSSSSPAQQESDMKQQQSHDRDENAPPNRLINESSPYLLQHAHNPVDWYPWGEEAIERARAEDKLIFLSVGYSTCYWCHVMERESFEDAATAGIMNEHFVCIKVDREERPDIDDIYMAATQLLTGRGGWPMSVFIEPTALRPIYAGTYFPPEPRHGMPSFTQILEGIANAWSQQRDAVIADAERIAQAMQQHLVRPGAVATLSADIVLRAAAQLLSIHDPDLGGFGGAPKFPQPVFLELLLSARPLADEALQARIDIALITTLDHMAMGGMHDHVGGGFHRYSTDAKWLVPHFEKMLYDNAQLTSVYARAAAVYDDDWYRDIVRSTLDYVLREMTNDDGSFRSAQDAEVNAREGQNYLWTAAQIRDVLEDAGLHDDIEFALSVYGVDEGTNFRDPHHQDEPPSNVLFLAQRPATLAQQHGMSRDAFMKRMSRINAALYAARMQRDQPGMDDKVIASWNGMMIRAFADGYELLGDDRYRAAAEAAATAVLQELRNDSGELLRTARNGIKGPPAFLEDYAALAGGLLALARATDQATWRDEAITLLSQADAHFADIDRGGWFDTRADQPDLFIHTRNTHDGAVPSGNSLMLGNLSQIVIKDDAGDKELATAQLLRALKGISSDVAASPVSAALAASIVADIAVARPDLLPRATAAISDAAATHADGPVALSLMNEDDGFFVLTIDIEPGYHINAHEPGDATRAGTVLSIADAEGVTLEAKYPIGEVYREDIRIYTEHIEIPFHLIYTGHVKGTPALEIRWQVCTDRECLLPVVHRMQLAK
ncbi:MAG: DUF255 domain-containing protein [Phycisphaerales bacterium]